MNIIAQFAGFDGEGFSRKTLLAIKIEIETHTWP